MNTSTFEKYLAASKLQGEALQVMNRIEAKADEGVRKAEKLLDSAWLRYNRRAKRTYEAAYRHWGDL